MPGTQPSEQECPPAVDSVSWGLGGAGWCETGSVRVGKSANWIQLPQQLGIVCSDEV